MSEQPPYQQLKMVWSQSLFNAPPPHAVPADYTLCTDHPDDEQQFYTPDQWRQSDN